MLDSVIRRIDKAIDSGTSKTLIINLEKPEDYRTIQEHLAASSKVKTLYASNPSFHNTDELPDAGTLYNYLDGISQPVALFGFADEMRIEGDESARFMLGQLLGHSYAYTVIVVCYRCNTCLPSTTPRDRDRVISIGESRAAMPRLYFIPSHIKLPEGYETIDGIEHIAEHLQKGITGKCLVRTHKVSRDFPDCPYTITDMGNTHDLLQMIDDRVKDIPEDSVDHALWNMLLSDMESQGSLEKVVRRAFGNPETYEYQFDKWKDQPPYRQWLLFLGLKLFTQTRSAYLAQALQSANGPDDLLHALYFGILSVKPNDKRFTALYAERKRLLGCCNTSIQESAAFCKFVEQSRGAEGLWYLTDTTQPERECTIRLLGTYATGIGEEKVREAIALVYPDLYQYMQPYPHKNSLLQQYFALYTYSKVTNHIHPKLAAIVQEQAEKREYNYLLPSRSEVVDEIQGKAHSHLYFVDAMGAEFLSYLLYCCHQEKLMARVRLARCSLPSITSCNKEFLEVFQAAGASLSPDIKDLDEIKHKGKQDFLYSKNRNPLHLIEEMRIIRELVRTIAVNLASEEKNKAVIIADHGASRLAVISDTTETIESNEKGTHGGRIRRVDGAHDDIPNAVKTEDGWIVLADYNLFKGGRAANVETHGGATLEEVTVPIVENIHRTGYHHQDLGREEQPC